MKANLGNPFFVAKDAEDSQSEAGSPVHNRKSRRRHSRNKSIELKKITNELVQKTPMEENFEFKPHTTKNYNLLKRRKTIDNLPHPS